MAGEWRGITAKFRSGQEANYTMHVFWLLSTDPDVEWVIDSETGEVLYDRDHGVLSKEV